MRQVVDTEAGSTPTLQDAERACEDLHDQVERARKVLRDYRASVAQELPDDDKQS
jgi:hypothetical protein